MQFICNKLREKHKEKKSLVHIEQMLLTTSSANQVDKSKQNKNPNQLKFSVKNSVKGGIKLKIFTLSLASKLVICHYLGL